MRDGLAASAVRGDAILGFFHHQLRLDSLRCCGICLPDWVSFATSNGNSSWRRYVKL